MILLIKGDHITRPLAAAKAQWQELQFSKYIQLGFLFSSQQREAVSEIKVYCLLMTTPAGQFRVGKSCPQGGMNGIGPTNEGDNRAQGHSHNSLRDQIQLVRRWQRTTQAQIIGLSSWEGSGLTEINRAEPDGK